MKRQISQEETRALVQNIRDKIPEIHLRTTMLVGFPGETENDFNTLCKFIEETKFERLGVFQYSHEEDTSAYKLDDNIPPEIKEERALALMQIQEQISFESNQQKIGKTCLLYTSDAADERSSVDLGGRRIIKKKTIQNLQTAHKH